MEASRQKFRVRPQLIIAIVIVVLVMFSLAGVFEHHGRAREQARRARCRSNLMQIGLALGQYSLDNDGTMPWGDSSVEPACRYFGTLHPAYESSIETFRCPSSGETFLDSDTCHVGGDLTPFTSEACKEGLSYAYGHNRGKPWTDSAQSTTHLAADKFANADYTDGDLWERPNNHRGDGRNVLSLDGSARWDNEKGPLEADPEYEFEGSGDPEHDQTGPDWWSDPPEK